MENAGSALMGIGQGSGENRAVDAAKAAIDSPLLELSIEGAKGILFTITGGPDLGMYEVNEAARIITSSADPNARVIFGSVIEESMKDQVKITVIATGFGGKQKTVKKVRPMEFGTREEDISVKQTPFFSTNRVRSSAPERPQKATLAPTVKTSSAAKTDEKTKEEEDLEIPAFIRKKMM